MSQVCSLEGLQSLNFENRIIQGDNHDVLRELQSELRSKVKCIYIDPPYNTGSGVMHILIVMLCFHNNANIFPYRFPKLFWSESHLYLCNRALTRSEAIKMQGIGLS